MERAKQRKKIYTEQVNVWVTGEMKTRIRTIKQRTDVDPIEEIRKAIERVVSEIETEHFSIS